jgi:hypothetical protein
MQKGERFRLVAVISLVIALMSAGFALAGDSLRPPRNKLSACEPTDDPVEENETVEDGDLGASEEDGSEESDETEGCEDVTEDTENAEDTEAPADDEGVESDEGPAPEPTEERIAECTEAAGLTAADAPDEKPIPGELKGLENAISHVLWNCIRNDNDGLVNALEHLSSNLERKELRDETKEERESVKAEREAEREAAKTVRKAAHEAAKEERKATRAS